MEDFYKDIPCVYFCTSDDGTVIEANETLCRLLCCSVDELKGRKAEGIFTLATRIFQQTHFYPLLQLKGHAEEIYITLKCKNGKELPVLINAVRKETDQHIALHYAGIVLNTRKIFEDEIIAAKKEAEKALAENTELKAAKKELQEHAEELDIQIALTTMRNRELQQFNHLATHTFQEPLRKLLFYSSQIIETEKEKTTPVALLKIRKAAVDMDIKLKGLQQYVWLTNKELNGEKIDLGSVTDFAVKELETEHPGISIMLETEAIPVIEADREQMQFVLKEILSNAVYFRKPGNKVHVQVTAGTLLMNQFRELEGKYKYTEFLKLQIRDRGMGFDDQYGEQAFELFRKLHSTGGAGIGLSLCRKMAENHGGSISIESETGKGSTVTLFLPLKQNEDFTGGPVS